LGVHQAVETNMHQKVSLYRTQPRKEEALVVSEDEDELLLDPLSQLSLTTSYAVSRPRFGQCSKLHSHATCFLPSAVTTNKQIHTSTSSQLMFRSPVPEQQFVKTVRLRSSVQDDWATLFLDLIDFHSDATALRYSH
jgi:hypothetical protein